MAPPVLPNTYGPDLTAPAPTAAPAAGGVGSDHWHWWKNNAARAQKEMLQKDLKRLENPMSLGLTDPQKKQMIADATSAANAQQQAQVSQLGQQALAGTGVQSGAIRQAATDVASHASDAAVGASANVEDLNARLIQQEADRIRGALDAQREKARENAQFWAKLGIDGFTSILGTILGGEGPTGEASGGGV